MHIEEHHLYFLNRFVRWRNLEKDEPMLTELKKTC